MLIVLFAMCLSSSASASPTDWATNYIRGFHESVCPADRPGCIKSIQRTPRWKIAPVLAAAIVHAAGERIIETTGEPVPWHVLLVLTQFESSYNPKAVGLLGEVGLGQGHGLATRGYDMSTVEGQLASTANWYARGIETCNCRLRALNWYQSGRCITTVEGARRRLKVIEDLEARLSHLTPEDNSSESHPHLPAPTSSYPVRVFHTSPTFAGIILPFPTF